MTGTSSQVSRPAVGGSLLQSVATVDLLTPAAGTLTDLPGMSFTTSAAGLYAVTMTVRGRVLTNQPGGAWITGQITRADTNALLRRVMCAHASVPGTGGWDRVDGSGTMTWVGQLPAGVVIKGQAFRGGSAATEGGTISDGNGHVHGSWTFLG